MKLQVTESVQNLALPWSPAVLQIFEIFQSVPHVQKIAEQRSRIPPLSKKSVALNCQSSDGWIFEKTVKWSVGEGGGIQ